ncbi:MAG: NAD(P)/FAD-dependent oxidoreductase [Rhodospirillales bacterium]
MDVALKNESHAILKDRIRAAAADPNLETMLAEADISPTLLTLAHISGDDDFLDEARPYIEGGWSFMVHIPEELATRIRTRLAEVLREIASGNREVAPPPSGERLHRLMNVGVGMEMPSSYVPMMIEEMQFDDRDPRTVEWRKAKPDGLENFKIVIVGAGLSGLGLAIKLKEAGYNFTIYDRADAVGGTWYVNRYPGCGVDTPNHFFSYSFEPNHDWSEHFSKRDELWGYQESLANTYGLRPHIELKTEVLSADFNESSQIWVIRIRRENGTEETVQANVFITAVGQLNTPNIPAIEGLENFNGSVLHTAEWDDSVSLEGRNVAMIGTGASGMQTGPSIAPKVSNLTIFQRSPHWAIPNANYHKRVAEGMKWTLKSIPFYAKWNRFLLFWAGSDVLHDSLHIDPSWPSPDLSLNAQNQKFREDLISHMRQEMGGNEELLSKTTPPYPPYGKRMLRDNHWYRMLVRDNVNLVTEQITRVTDSGIETHDGQEHTCDTIILATGFQTTRMLGPLGESIRNENKETLRQSWNEDDPRAHLGIMTLRFPNLFMMYGPGTNLAHGGSIIFHMECQIRYIMQALRELTENGHNRMEVRAEPHDAYNAKLDAKHYSMVWTHKGVNNWYKNKAGRVFANSPWRLVDYWAFTQKLKPEEYEFS